MATTTMYGIPNCDTIKKARAFLAARGVDYRFHDYKKQGVPADELAHWVAGLGWERLVNRQGTAWRKLAPGVQAGVHDAASAIALMLAQPSVIKRPVLCHGDTLQVGFAAATWTSLFP
jgi:Spx/MgsR family transcriptional regulator